MALDGFVREKHLAKDVESFGEQVERGMGSNEGVEEESGLVIGEAEEKDGFVELGTASVGVYELCSDEFVAGDSESQCPSVDLSETFQAFCGSAGFEEVGVQGNYVVRRRHD